MILYLPNIHTSDCHLINPFLIDFTRLGKSKGFKSEGSGAMEIGNTHKLRKGEIEEYITGLKTGKIRFNVGSSVVKNIQLKAYVRFARPLVWLIFCSGLKALHEKLCSIIMITCHVGKDFRLRLSHPLHM